MTGASGCMARLAGLVLAILVCAAALAPSPVLARDLRVGLQLEPPNLDPTAGAAAAVDEVVYGNVFEGLVRVGRSGALEPALAETWEISPDGRVYVFHLRSGVRFHDGRAFDAQSVRFSLERAMAEGSANAQKKALEVISGIETPDKRTVRLTLKAPSARLLQVLAWGDAVMVSPQSAQANAVSPVGTGPFRFVEWRRGDSIVLERNPAYWGRPARVDRVIFRFISDPSAAVSAMRAGDLDAFPNFPAPESLAALKADPRFRVVVGATEGETILAMNNARPPFNDLRVRRAISHAIDRDAIIRGAMFGYGKPIGSHLAPTNPAYVDLTGLYPHDPARARQLLAEAGYPDGFSVVLKLPPPSYARRSGEIIAAQLAQVGIRARVENMEWSQWLDQVLANHDFDMTIVSHTEPADYDIYGRDYYFGYSSAAFDALLEREEAAVDPAERARLLGDIQRRIADDAVNGFLFMFPKLNVWDARLKGLWVDMPVQANDVSEAYFEGDPQSAAAPAAAAARSDGPPGWVAAGLLGLLVAAAAIRLGPAYVGARLASLLATFLAATVVIFLLIQVVPGDPAAYMMGLNANPEAVAALRAQMGLDAPLAERYLRWVAGLAHGDFGTSYTYRVGVSQLIAERLAVSAPLALIALGLSVAVALPLGLYAASRRGRAGDTLVMGAAQVGIALPNFWFAMLLVLVFSVGLRWLPAGGFPGWEAGAGPALAALILPALALGAPQAAILARVLRSALIDTMGEDYIRTARAKGLSPGQTLRRHALRNAAIPFLTIIGLQAPFLLAGGVIVENVFFLPGLGRLVFQAITQRDLIVVQSVVVVLVMAVVVINFLVDLAYAAIDPRLRRRS